MIRQGAFATSFFDAPMAINFLKKLLTKKNANPNGVKIMNGVTELLHRARSEFLVPMLKTTFKTAFNLESDAELLALAEPPEEGMRFPCMCPLFEESDSDNQPTGARLMLWASQILDDKAYTNLLEV
jgi:hypothetical protein